MKFKKGQKVRIVNLNDQDPDFISDMNDHLIGATGYIISKVEDQPVYDEMYDTDERGHDTAYSIEVPEYGSFYLFEYNFKLLNDKALSPPKTEIEWLDKVQANFKE